mmetsp:Transcript_23440/g.55858  ORF Transcript_23440/g.55858 Transcript_23440/m.55858 type:complete len:291 (+) Transcript_23440:583-1455(+)
MRICCGSMAAVEDCQRSGTRIPILASYRTHSSPSFAVPFGQASHCSDDVENTNPSSHSNTSWGNSHDRSPPDQTGGSLLARSSDPDCHRHVSTRESETVPSAPVVGRRFFISSGCPAALLSPVSRSNSTCPDAPWNDASRISLSSAALSTDPSAPNSILLIAIAAAHTASYIVAQYPPQPSAVVTASNISPSKMLLLRYWIGVLSSAPWNRGRLSPCNASIDAVIHPLICSTVRAGSALDNSTLSIENSLAAIQACPVASSPCRSAAAATAAMSCSKAMKRVIRTPESAI